MNSSDNLISAAWTSQGSDHVESLPIADLLDEQLMLRVKGGDHTSLAVLMKRHARIVLGVGRRVLHDQGAAEELVQDVFFLVYKRCQVFDPRRGSFRAWLVRIAYNEAYRSRQRVSLRHINEQETLDQCLDIMEVTADPEYQVAVAQGEKTLRQAFRRLSNRQKETMELFFFEGYTLREISEQLGEPLGNVRHYYYRGLQDLKETIDKYYVRPNRHDS